MHNTPMRKHLSATLVLLAATLLTAAPAVMGQTKGFVPGKTPDG